MPPRLLLLVALLAVPGCTGAGDTDPGETDDTGPVDRGALLGIGLSPREPVAAVGETVQMYVKAYYEDTSTEDWTDRVTWTSTRPRVATVDAAGALTAVAPGETDVIITDDRGVSAKTTLTVRGGDDDGPQAVAIRPAAVALAVDDTVELRATATFADGSEGNLADRCTWSVDDDAVAALDGPVLTGRAEGRTTVRATCAGLSAAAPVTVEATDEALALPDLILTEVLTEGTADSAVVLAEVRNTGEGMSAITFVDLTTADPATGAPAADTALVDALGPGDTAIVLVERPDLPPGDVDVWLEVDPEGGVEEASEANNVAGPYTVAVGAGVPDLAITDFAAVTDGEATLWEVTVANRGDGPARGFWVDLYRDPADDPEVCDLGDDFELIDRLEAGATRVVAFYAEAAPADAWLSVAFVDSCDEVVESDESNNLEYAIVE